MSDSDIGAIIAGMEQFQIDGEFSSPLYQNTLASAGYTPSLFQRNLREDLLLTQLRAGLSASEFATPTELGASATVTAEQRDVRYLRLPLASFNQVSDVSEDDIEAYYDTHSEDFMTRRKRRYQLHRGNSRRVLRTGQRRTAARGVRAGAAGCAVPDGEPGCPHSSGAGR